LPQNEEADASQKEAISYFKMGLLGQLRTMQVIAILGG
jgi:hypothetical protein